MTIRKITLFVSALLAATFAMAQTNGSNSPYSRYGFGLLNDRYSARTTDMAGTGLGSRSGAALNVLNPASYSAIDSLTFLFDAGLTLQNNYLTEGSLKVNARNTSLDYITVGFRLRPRLGFSLGLLPYSTVGYDFSRKSTMQSQAGEVTQTNAYRGDGGLHVAYAGIGWEPLRGLSVGANFGYLWGDIDHSVTSSFSDATISTLRRQYSASLHTYKADFGLQYVQAIGKKHTLTLGLSYGLGHDINRKAFFYDLKSVGNRFVGDTIGAAKAFALPTSFGAGLSWTWNRSLTLSLDYNLQKWADVRMPELSVGADGRYIYNVSKGQLLDRSRFSAGVEYIANEEGLRWRDHVRYRAGFSYASPYVRVNGQDGPKSYIISAGVGLPVNTNYSNRCIVNLGVQYEHVAPGAKTLLKEDYIRFTIGISFNERWFAKWKAQ